MKSISNEWVTNSHLDGEFLWGRISIWLTVNSASIPNVPFILRMYFPTIAREYLHKRIGFGELVIQTINISNLKSGERFVEVWNGGRIPIEIFRDRGISTYSIKRDLLRNSDNSINLSYGTMEMLACKSNNLEQWLSDFSQSNYPDMDELKDLLQKTESSDSDLTSLDKVNSLDEFCFNVNNSAKNILQIVRRHEMLLVIIYVIGSFSCHPEAKQFLQICYKMMFCEYDIKEEIQEWLPRDLYDKIVCKVNNAKKVFEQSIVDCLKLKSEGLKASFMHLASIEYSKGQFARLDENEVDNTTSATELDTSTGFTRLVERLQKNL